MSPDSNIVFALSKCPYSIAVNRAAKKKIKTSLWKEEQKKNGVATTLAIMQYFIFIFHYFVSQVWMIKRIFLRRFAADHLQWLDLYVQTYMDEKKKKKNWKNSKTKLKIKQKNTMQMYVEGSLSRKRIDCSCRQVVYLRIMLQLFFLSEPFQELHSLKRLQLCQDGSNEM